MTVAELVQALLLLPQHLDVVYPEEGCYVYIQSPRVVLDEQGREYVSL